MLQKLIDEIETENMEYVKNNSVGNPRIAIINTNLDDEASQRYIRNKVKKMNEFGIDVEIHCPNSRWDFETLIDSLNIRPEISGIIIQHPISKTIKIDTQVAFDLVNPHKDIDRLSSAFKESKNENHLPVTAHGIYKLIEKLPKKRYRILFLGAGATTNKRLFDYMFQEGKHHCRILNSKNSEIERQSDINWAEIIVASTGRAEILRCTDKIVISPSIIKTDKGFKSDISDLYRHLNLTHEVLKSIGKMTLSGILRRCYEVL